jgi:hypothetical protein
MNISTRFYLTLTQLFRSLKIFIELYLVSHFATIFFPKRFMADLI